jgi:hypothetical protein
MTSRHSIAFIVVLMGFWACGTPHRDFNEVGTTEGSGGESASAGEGTVGAGASAGSGTTSVGGAPQLSAVGGDMSAGGLPGNTLPSGGMASDEASIGQAGGDSVRAEAGAGGHDDGVSCEPNACGGCGKLAAVPGGSCGRCGTYVCLTDKATVTCEDAGLNACGGCGKLAAAPSSACGACGNYACSADRSSVSCSDPGKNACGGCGVLSVDPGADCGSCGIYACTADKSSVACNGTGTNACGGCGTLSATPGAACGQCGKYACSGDKSSVSCNDPGKNACGGCGVLTAAPDDLCGTCGKYVCSKDKATVSCAEPPTNACGGCSTLSAAPGSACGKCGKNQCSADKNSVTCSDVTCGSCQTCSAPLTCSTLPANAAGQCSSNQYCDGASSVCSTCPTPASASALHYVDPVLGKDDPSHGGAYGACGYKTITYALAHATGQIALQTATYSPESGETFPIVLKGNQALLCQYTTKSPAKISGKGMYSKININVAVAFEGTQNALFNCVVDGGGGTGYCVDIFSSGSAFPQVHDIVSSDVSNCGGAAIMVEADVSNVSISDSNLHGSLLGTFWAGTNTGASQVNNTYSGNSTDIQCELADPGVTGNSNTGVGGKPTCVNCANCSF